MRLFRRKCALLLDLFALTALCFISVLVVHTFWSRPRGGGDEEDTGSFLASRSLAPTASAVTEAAQDQENGWKAGVTEVTAQPREASPRLRTRKEREVEPAPWDHPANCTMGRCFDTSKCRGDFRVYVYPDREGAKVSGLFKSILRILRCVCVRAQLGHAGPGQTE